MFRAICTGKGPKLWGEEGKEINVPDQYLAHGLKEGWIKSPIIYIGNKSNAFKFRKLGK